MPSLIGSVPPELSEKLFEEYLEVKKRFFVGDWGPGQLKGGRFAEVVLRIFQSILGLACSPLGTDIPANEKTKLLNTVINDGRVDEHVRQLVVPITRLLLDFRNKRDAAHLGGFDANEMDASYVLASATWVLCELIRVYGGQTMPEAQRIVHELVLKDFPTVIEFEGEIHIARNNLTAKQEALVLLYRTQKADFEFLFSKTRDGNRSRFRDALKEMERSKLIGLKDQEYFLMPLGKKGVEDSRLLAF
ncbi:MAG: hypothetical protein NUV84_02100 [Candidatus Uhrbacteria bacterium]|nr:hypothetical protein [Candidatus Uhrbacteria bacterium]